MTELSLFLEMLDVPYRPRAYEKAAQAVAGMEPLAAELYATGGVKALDTIPSVGEGIAKRIAELIETGHCRELDELRERMPVDLLGLTAVEGLGPKLVKHLFEGLNIRTLDDLERAAEAKRIRELPHFGARSEQKLLRGVRFQREAHGRVPLGHVLDLALAIERRLAALPGVTHAASAGSVRRRKETIGDLDFVVASEAPAAIAAAFVAMPEVEHVHARGVKKTLVRLRSGLDADLRVVPARSWGAALCYFTGCKAHNVALRLRAQKRGLKLNEYGLFRGARQLAGRTEQQLYAALDLPFIPPELREDAGELEAAEQGALPALIPYGALRGDLQTQTDWTDGADGIEEMALAARTLGLEYIAITDHTRDLAIASGNDDRRLLEQLAAIRALDARMRGIRILAGAEVNIRRDGSLDVSDDTLARLDVVGAGLHSHFHDGRRELTQRLIKAMENPHVDILLHPTARAFGQRPACDVDLDAVFAAAHRTGTALEIDGHPARMDLKDEHVRRALQSGVKLVISSDAHEARGLRYANDLGVAIARRGWATKADVLNTRRAADLLAALK